MRISPSAALLSVLLAMGLGKAQTQQQQTNTQTSLNNVKPRCGLDIAGPNWICVNDDDNNTNEIWDWDETPLDNGAEPVPGEDDTRPITVKATMPETCIGPAQISVAAIAGLGRIDGFFPGTKTVKDTRTGESVSGDDAAAAEKRVAKMHPYFFTVWPGQTVEVRLWIEGVSHSSEGLPDVVIQAASTSQVCGVHGAMVPAEHKMRVYQADLDLDSNNNEGTTFTEGSREEDEIENSLTPKKYPAPNWPTRPGKLIMANDGFGDDIPDWADGFLSDPMETQTYVCGPPIRFVPMLLERKPPFTAACTVKFTYDGSHPLHDLEITSGGGFPSYDKRFSTKKGVMRIWTKDNSSTPRSRLSVPTGDYVPDAVEIPWTDLADESATVARLWVEALEPSPWLGAIQVTATVKEAGAQVDDTVRMTSLKVTCEPITAEPQYGLYPYNPAGIVKGESADYRIEVEPAGFPDAEIVWDSGGLGPVVPLPSSFNSTTRIARFYPSSAGDGHVTAAVAGNYYPQPWLPVRVFANWSDINLNLFVTASDGSYGTTPGDPAATDAELADIVSRLNDIHRQAGIRYSNVKHILNGTYFVCDNQTKEDSLVSTPRNGITGLEIYFVGGNGRRWNGINYGTKGIIISSRESSLSPMLLGKVLAHEIGHTCGLRDIYDEKEALDSSGTITYFAALGLDAAKLEWSPDDWPSAAGFNCDPSFYMRLVSGYETARRIVGHDAIGNPIYEPDYDAYATRQRSLVPRLLMYGYSDPSDPPGKKIDLARGRVYGVEGGYGDSYPLDYGDVAVGLSEMNRVPEHQ